MQDLVQQVLEEEVTEFLRRAKSARRSDTYNDSGYRNGFARPRKLMLSPKMMLKRIPYAETRKESELLKNLLSRWCAERGHESASTTLERDWERMVAFYDYPKEHWQHLRTTNRVESPFASLRLRTDAARRYKWVDRAIAVIWKILMVRAALQVAERARYDEGRL